MVAMFEWLRAACVWASRVNRGQAVRVVCERVGQDLEGDVALELRVTGAVHLAHAAFTDLGGDFVHADARTGDEGQPQRDYMGEAASLVQSKAGIPSVWLMPRSRRRVRP
jgi:hypothetical protein